MGIFLTVLKILGFVLLGILALVLTIILLIILLIFTVPVKYEGHLELSEQSSFEIKVHWLLRAIYARLKTGGPEGTVEEIRVLWKQIELGGGMTIDDVLDFLFPPIDDETFRKENEEDLSITLLKKQDFDRAFAEEDDFIEEEASPDTFLSRVADFFLQKTEGLRSKYHKLKKQKRFLQRERTKAALRKLLDLVVRIIRTVFPKVLLGRLHIGLSSPADTGQLLGGLSMLLPLTKEHLEIEPDFQQEVLEGTLDFSTSVRVGRLIVEVVRIILNRDVRYFMRRFRKYL